MTLRICFTYVLKQNAGYNIKTSIHVHEYQRVMRETALNCSLIRGCVSSPIAQSVQPRYGISEYSGLGCTFLSPSDMLILILIMSWDNFEVILFFYQILFINRNFKWLRRDCTYTVLENLGFFKNVEKKIMYVKVLLLLYFTTVSDTLITIMIDLINFIMCSLCSTNCRNYFNIV
jgi:hypothetical protein